MSVKNTARVVRLISKEMKLSELITQMRKNVAYDIDEHLTMIEILKSIEKVVSLAEVGRPFQMFWCIAKKAILLTDSGRDAATFANEMPRYKETFRISYDGTEFFIDEM